MIEIEVHVKVLFIDIVVIHDLEEFFKFFLEVVFISRSLEFHGPIIKSSTSGFGKKLVGFVTPNTGLNHLLGKDVFILRFGTEAHD
jgi:hypothetical protein